MKTALLIIDMQRDFVLPGGALRVAGAASTAGAIDALRRRAATLRWKVIHVIRLHDAAGVNVDLPRRRLFRDGGMGYCVEGTWGAEIIDELTPMPGEEVFVKTRNSAFCRTDLEQRLRRDGVERVVIAGTQYPNCIRATANDAMSLDFQTVVATDCCSAQTPEIAAANITDLRNMGIACLHSSEIS